MNKEQNTWNQFDMKHVYNSQPELFQEHTWKQYNMYVESAEKVSDRRLKTNQFYIAILSGVLTILSFAFEKNAFEDLNSSAIYLLVSILGLVLCFVWRLNIHSYQQLNTGKFHVINELEKKLPMSLYEKEWEILKSEANKKKYLRLSVVEKYIPLILGIPYLLLFGISLYMLLM